MLYVFIIKFVFIKIYYFLTEDDGEVFKVKKSSQSKRLAKRREKEKQRDPDGDDIKYDNEIQEVMFKVYI